MKKLFTDHPREVGMNYWSHFWGAFMHAMACFNIGFFLVLHSIFPFWFITTASEKITRLYNDLRVPPKP